MSLFKPATAKGRKGKILLYGPPDCGKTVAALTGERCAVIDGERGTILYADQVNVKPFQVTYTTDPDVLMNAINEIKEDNGRNFSTLVIDPITVFIDKMKGTHIQTVRFGMSLRYDQRAEINERMKPIYTALADLPVHLICTARQVIDYEVSGKSLIKSGVKPDIDRSGEYLFDYIIRIDETHAGHFEKHRGLVNPPSILKRVTWEALRPYIEAPEETPVQPPAVSDEQLAAMKEFFAGAKEMGLTREDWLDALGVNSFAEFGDWTDAATTAKARKAGNNFKAARLLNMGNSNAQQDATN